MSTKKIERMTVDQFLAWADSQPGRWELYDGVPYATAPERAQHAKVKHRIAKALERGIEKAGCGCFMLPDGMTVRVDDNTAHEPDALVYCGQELPPDAVEVPTPVIVVEVLSPSTRRIDAAAKMMGYFSLPSVMHYLIVDPDKRPIIHHRRLDATTIISHIVHAGDIPLAPPGIVITIEEIAPGE